MLVFAYHGVQTPLRAPQEWADGLGKHGAHSNTHGKLGMSAETYLRFRQKRLRQARFFLLLRPPSVLLALFLFLFVLDELFLLLEDLELLLVARLVVDLKLGFVEL